MLVLFSRKDKPLLFKANLLEKNSHPETKIPNSGNRPLKAFRPCYKHPSPENDLSGEENSGYVFYVYIYIVSPNRFLDMGSVGITKIEDHHLSRI